MAEVTDPALLAQLNSGAQPASHGPVYGAPPPPAKPSSPEERARLVIEGKRLAIEQNKEARETYQTSEKARRVDTSAAAEARTVLDKIDQVGLDANDNGGWGETGATGELMRNMPRMLGGGPAKDLSANIATIDANNAFNRLMQMRQDSPTGGAVGNVSDADMALLKSTTSNLDPNQSHEQFMRNLAEQKTAWLHVLTKLDHTAAQSYLHRPGVWSSGTSGYYAGTLPQKVIDRLAQGRGAGGNSSKVIHYDAQGKRLP